MLSGLGENAGKCKQTYARDRRSSTVIPSMPTQDLFAQAILHNSPQHSSPIRTLSSICRRNCEPISESSKKFIRGLEKILVPYPGNTGLHPRHWTEEREVVQ